MLASALHRLELYEQAFGFTRTRLAVDAFLLCAGALFVLVVVALAIDRRAWLPRATVLLGAVGALAFSLSDPDARIAAHNVERFEATGSIDVDYLAGLSADAVPALVAPAAAAARSRARRPAAPARAARRRPRAAPTSRAPGTQRAALPRADSGA